MPVYHVNLIAKLRLLEKKLVESQHLNNQIYASSYLKGNPLWYITNRSDRLDIIQVRKNEVFEQ